MLLYKKAKLELIYIQIQKIDKKIILNKGDAIVLIHGIHDL